MKHAPVHGDPRPRAKRAAAYAAVEMVEQGMTVGLGTGSTAAFVVEALAARVRAGLRIKAVATSRRTAMQAGELGIDIIDFTNLESIDLAIDGADEVDHKLRAIKGAGGAMLREKIVATAARRMICVVDSSKTIGSIGRCPVPVEILPSAEAFVAARVASFGAAVTVRMAKNEAYRTDQGNAVLDCVFPEMPDPERIAVTLSTLPGVLGHGLFLDEIDRLFIGRADCTVVVRDRSALAIAPRRSPAAARIHPMALRLAVSEPAALPQE